MNTNDNGAARTAAPFRVDMLEVPAGVPIEICPVCGARVCRVARRLVGHSQSFALATVVEPFEFPVTLMPLHPCPGALEKLGSSDRPVEPALPAYSVTDTEDVPVAQLHRAFSPRVEVDNMTTATPTPRAANHCAAIGCRKTVPSSMLMCSAHWFMVPSDLRGKIWALHREVQRGDESRKQDHFAACVQAVKAVRDREGGDDL